MIKKFLLRSLDGTRLLACYTLLRQGFLVEAGWFRSWHEKRAVDRSGEPIPWITYPSLAFLQTRLRKEFRLFEYGCGNSTLWFARRVREVVSCEHDPAWHAEVQRRIPKNVDLRLERLGPEGRYAGSVREFTSPFDVIFVDGRERVDCLRNAPAALTPLGVVILDNSDESEYVAGIEYVLSLGFKRLDFIGPGPITTNVWSTTVFYRPDNCFGI
jgi:Methyltransferase domain